mgnify:CR=1 FL=1
MQNTFAVWASFSSYSSPTVENSYCNSILPSVKSRDDLIKALLFDFHSFESYWDHNAQRIFSEILFALLIFVVVGWFQDSERYIQISRAFVHRQKGKKKWNKKAFPSGRHTFDWFLIIPQDLENCIRLREAQVRKIEDTIQNLQEECPSNVNDEDTVISNDSCFNQDLIKLSEKIRQQRGGVLDFEMVIKCKYVTTIIIKILLK